MEATKLYVQLWVITPHCSLCDKSLFMIMTQEEVIDTDASGAEYVTFMHIQCRQKTNCICFLVSEHYMWCRLVEESNTSDLLEPKTHMCGCKFE